MAKVRIGSGDAARLSRLLRELARGRELPAHLRHTADFWSSEMHRRMERQDLQEIAWLLQDASTRRSARTSSADKAQYWAAYLEGRVR